MMIDLSGWFIHDRQHDTVSQNWQSQTQTDKDSGKYKFRAKSHLNYPSDLCKIQVKKLNKKQRDRYEVNNTEIQK